MTKKIKLPRPNATGVGYWRRLGFNTFEATAFKNITTNAISDNKYLQQMIKERLRKYLRARKDGLTNREYNFRVRKIYLNLELVTDKKDIVKNDAKSRTTAFKLLDYYKNKYKSKDDEGNPIGTPRPKTKVVVKRGTSKSRLLSTTMDEIDRLQGRLQYPTSASERESLQRQLDNQRRRLNDLNSQMD